MSELAPLLYRARWLQSSLSGEVRSRRDRPGFDGSEELSGTLLTAPGGRYQAELVDEDGEPELMICNGQPGAIPFSALLRPSWLLADFELEITARLSGSIGPPIVWRAGPAR